MGLITLIKPRGLEGHRVRLQLFWAITHRVLVDM